MVLSVFTASTTRMLAVTGSVSLSITVAVPDTVIVSPVFANCPSDISSHSTENSPLNVLSASTPLTLSGRVGTVPGVVAVEILRIAITLAITCSRQVTEMGSIPAKVNVPLTV